ncbi:hypothetical protein [Photobacterium leiognathi]|uniref:hypothetical protein n=1 Tax=Photobacterium leiognathi TaxID=553611 RepID=UPI0029821D99|nr:hypothetical protein [Photobacterium leiognathi]
MKALLSSLDGKLSHLDGEWSLVATEHLETTSGQRHYGTKVIISEWLNCADLRALEEGWLDDADIERIIAENGDSGLELHFKDGHFTERLSGVPRGVFINANSEFATGDQIMPFSGDVTLENGRLCLITDMSDAICLCDDNQYGIHSRYNDGLIAVSDIVILPNPHTLMRFMSFILCGGDLYRERVLLVYSRA